MDLDVKDYGTAGTTVSSKASGTTVVNAINKMFSGAFGLATGLAFAIEYVTYALYFFEEGFVIFMRGYHDGLYWKNLPTIFALSYLDFDYMFNWYQDFLNHFGILAIYSYNAYVNYMYMLQMYRDLS